MLKLSVGNVSAGYGAVQALDDVSVEVREGEIVALLGTNGNGKSTLMKCIMGLVPARSGNISLSVDNSNLDLRGKSTEQIVNLGVAMVPEGRRLFPKLTVKENLLLGAFRANARAHSEQNLERCFAAFPVLRQRVNQLAGKMSGGQQQMVAIARAIMSAPRLLLIDEPSVGLSPALVQQTMDVIRTLQQEFKLTVLMAEQNYHEASRIADRGYVLVHGKIAFEGANLQELESSELVRSHYLGA